MGTATINPRAIKHSQNPHLCGQAFRHVMHSTQFRLSVNCTHTTIAGRTHTRPGASRTTPQQLQAEADKQVMHAGAMRYLTWTAAACLGQN